MALKFLNDGYFAGKVGIGTASPQNPLHVSGSLRVGPFLTPDRDGFVFIPGGTLNTIQANNENTNFDNNQGNIHIRTTNNSSVAPVERITVLSTGNVGIGTTTPAYKLSVSGGIEAGGIVRYSKVAGSLDTTGYAIAGLTAGFNGASAGFEFKCYGGSGQYQIIAYSCYCSGTTWIAKKVINEGTNVFNVEASASGATITFTFKTISGTQSYSPRVTIEATGHSINNTYA
jgi:hypothetical protein